MVNAVCLLKPQEAHPKLSQLVSTFCGSNHSLLLECLTNLSTHSITVSKVLCRIPLQIWLQYRQPMYSVMQCSLKRSWQNIVIKHWLMGQAYNGYILQLWKIAQLAHSTLPVPGSHEQGQGWNWPKLAFKFTGVSEFSCYTVSAFLYLAVCVLYFWLPIISSWFCWLGGFIKSIECETLARPMSWQYTQTNDPFQSFPCLMDTLVLSKFKGTLNFILNMLTTFKVLMLFKHEAIF